METGQTCEGWVLSAAGEGELSTWGHLRHRLGLSVTRSSKRLCEGRRRLLPSILLHGRLNGGLVLRQWNEGRRRKWKLDPTQPQTKSLVQFIKKKKKKGKSLHRFLCCKVHWLDSGLHAGSHGLLCSGNFCCKQSKRPFELNWNLQWTLLVLDQAQKKKVRAGQNVLGKIPLGVHLCLIVANSL